MDWKSEIKMVKRIIKTATIKTQGGEIHLREVYRDQEDQPINCRGSAVINGEETLRYYCPELRQEVINELTRLLAGDKIRGYDALSGRAFYEPRTEGK